MADFFFRRGAERLECQQQQDSSGYALILRSPGGGSITQRFPDATTLAKRRLALERMLTASGWVIEGGAVRRR